MHRLRGRSRLRRLALPLYVAVMEDGNERCRQSSGFSTTCFTAIWGEPHSQKSGGKGIRKRRPRHARPLKSLLLHCCLRSEYTTEAVKLATAIPAKIAISFNETFM
jgi:hypothetical protein